MLAAQIYEILNASPALDPWLGRYLPNGETLGRKAIFTATTPDAATLPLVSSVGNISDVPEITATTISRDITRDILLLASSSDDPAEIEDVADALYTEAWQWRSSIRVVGHHVIALYPSKGPTPAPTDETLRGRIITIRARLEVIT